MMTTFNPSQVEQGVLYPCHSIVLQFYVHDKKLSCSMYQRSMDVFLGGGFNIASTSLLVHIIAKLTDLDVGSVTINLGDYHIYSEHLEAVIEQLKRVPYDLPTLIMPSISSLEEVEQLSHTDFVLNNYQSHPAIKAPMIA
jgi:thymidylate synthase